MSILGIFIRSYSSVLVHPGLMMKKGLLWAERASSGEKENDLDPTSRPFLLRAADQMFLTQTRLARGQASEGDFIQKEYHLVVQ